MNEKKDGVPAFPSSLPFQGLTKRELFAAMAMQGLLVSNYSKDKNYADAYFSNGFSQAIAKDSLTLADSLLELRLRGLRKMDEMKPTDSKPQYIREQEKVMEKDGGPAFPSSPQKMFMKETGSKPELIGYEGMSLRDWFAGMALSAYLSDSVLSLSPDEALASWCYAKADAMLKKREKP